MDGAPLTQEGICQVYQLIEYLGKEPSKFSEHIFRSYYFLNAMFCIIFYNII